MSQNSLIVSYSDFRSVAGRGDLGLCHNQLTSSEATCPLCPGRKQHYKGETTTVATIIVIVKVLLSVEAAANEIKH